MNLSCGPLRTRYSESLNSLILAYYKLRNSPHYLYIFPRSLPLVLVSALFASPACAVYHKRLSLLNVITVAVFNVFHVRALYYTKTLITNKCTRRVLSSIVTHSYMFRPCWIIFREKFLLALHYGCTLQLSEDVLLTVDCVLEA
jgi:hypothetical protein